MKITLKALRINSKLTLEEASKKIGISRETLRSRMRYEYDLTDSEVSSMDRFFDDFQTLADAPEIQKIVSDTEDYKNSIEEAWKTSSPSIMKYIKDMQLNLPV